MTAEPAAATRHAATYPGRADQLHHVRRAVTRHLAGCAAANDAVLIASELAANAILHSRSRAGHFTIRTELYPDHVRIEAEDSGGPWRRRQSDGRPHGLDMVEALTGPGSWGTETTTSGGRIVWARLDLVATDE
jgi:anti-sigma regulatory factor (Ser/Thr protein kinase)